MNLPSPILRLCWLALVLCAVGTISNARAQVYKGVTLVNADLLADTTAIAPGKPFTVGLRLKMAPHWHTYWQNSGDAGLPTKIVWTLPEGFKAGPIQWPVPEKMESAGDIVNYGYSDEVVLLTEITPPAQLPPGETTLKAKADWLVCEALCIPGSQELELKLPAETRAASAPLPGSQRVGDLREGWRQAAEFVNYRESLPNPPDEKHGLLEVKRRMEGKDLVLDIKTKITPEYVKWNLSQGEVAPWEKWTIDFYPLPGQADIGHPTAQVPKKGWESNGETVLVTVRVPIASNPADADQIGGVLGFHFASKTAGWSIPAPAQQPPSPAASTAVAVPGAADSAPSSPPPIVSGASSLWHFLFLGFLGGLILNVMPCVLPVISLKVFSFIKQADNAPERIFKLGLAYAAGVFAWFLGFAAMVVALKAGGREVGYAFHLQNPWFVVGLSVVVFVFALNLLGVFEFVLPGSVNAALSDASQRNEGYSGAFFQGVLATVLSSACTGPLFGAALGFAFVQSAPVIFAFFTFVALGMSLPFVLLTAWPAWLRFLPKPGMWMERVKQATGFIMLATVLWLLFVLGTLRGADAIVWTGVLMLSLGVACWVQNTFNTLSASGRTRAFAVSAMLALALGGAWLSLPQIAAARLPVGRNDFQTQLQEALKEENRPVFIDFTAAWCVNCKVNERVVLATEPIQRALKEANAVFLTADFTAGDPAIAALLKKFGRAGVPLYVIYPADRSREPIVLPEILTQQLVLDGLKSAAIRKPALTSIDAP